MPKIGVTKNGKSKGKVTNPLTGQSVAVVKNFIVDDLLPLVRKIDGLKPDPRNARLHPDRNLAVIKWSLCKYGQRRPAVVNRKTMIVEVGNGMLQCAKELGWTKLACVMVDDEQHVATGYGLVDNRASDLAQSDFWRTAELLDELSKSGNALGAEVYSQRELLNLAAMYGDTGDDDKSGAVVPDRKPTWGVIVECDSEEQQVEAIDLLLEGGFKCRALTI